MKNLIPSFLALLLAIVLIGGYGFMYSHVASGIARAQAALEKATTLSTRDALVRSQQVFLENTANERASLNAFVASDEDVVAVIEIIESTARQEKVDVAISSINTVGGDGWGYHEKVAVNFSASGTFRNMMRFMSAVETIPLASKLEQASLEVATGSNWFGAFSVTFVKTK